jgi:hypothetical protein
MIALLAEGVPAECMAGTFNHHGWVALAVTVAGVAGAVYSLSKGFAWLREEAESRRGQKESPDRRAAKAWLLGLWVLLPPAWLYVEYIFLYRHFGKAACLESFRYAQEIVFRGWAGVVLVLGGLYFGREIFGRE